MMGRLKSDQGQLFYEFRLGDAVPEDHLVRKIDTALDLSWLRSDLAPHYSSMSRPSIDPELMIRMLVLGYVFAIRSERLICREVQVNLAYQDEFVLPPLPRTCGGSHRWLRDRHPIRPWVLCSAKVAVGVGSQTPPP